MPRVNKAAARDWHAQVRAQAELDCELEKQRELLWYAAEKRKTNYPSVEFFERAGLLEVAAHIRAAYEHLAAAYAACPERCRPAEENRHT